MVSNVSPARRLSSTQLPTSRRSCGRMALPNAARVLSARLRAAVTAVQRSVGKVCIH
ncbi:Uncharacterised protein [Mycobacterium tuberculosis]|uniref:Uncharacterized protein n=1 Tax=Mycobacterium tuberculosis TaxID=1773 RepID=A0A655IP74_MYCTX|nr:Uncharacterised protein [Mycobacterium tuberculosis]